MKEERSSRAKSVMNEEVNGRRGRGRPGPDKRSEGVKRAVKDRAHRKKREAGRQLARKRKDKNRKKERASREPARCKKRKRACPNKIRVRANERRAKAPQAKEIFEHRADLQGGRKARGQKKESCGGTIGP